jgi:hypothetical protein
MDSEINCPPLFRVWAICYHDWQPKRWDETPPRSRAVEPVLDACLSWAEACAVIEGFNETMLAEADRPGPPIGDLWAVAIRATLRLDGDIEPGQLAPPAMPPGDDCAQSPAQRTFS